MVYESLIRLASFCVVFILMASWELVAPLRPLAISRPRRWFANLALSLLDTLLVRAALPTAAVGVAMVAAGRGWGLLNLLGWPGWVQLPLAVVALDLLVYLQHVLFHALPLMWRFHMVHHSDLDVDVTTGVRFHPVEILVSAVIKVGAVALLGAPALAVLVFEALLNATSLFNHSNVRMSRGVERVLRWIVVTPDMHRIHHSADRRETDSNFGFNLPWWDRLLGTYRPDPLRGQEGLTLGLEQFREPDRLTLPRILALPFVGARGGPPDRGRGESPGTGAGAGGDVQALPQPAAGSAAKVTIS